MLSDIRFAFRQFRRSPGFVGLAVFSLALGLGANTAMFSVLRSALYRPLPYPESDRLVQLWSAVLQAVPHSRLVLKWKAFADPGFALHTQQRFVACGVDPARVQTRPATPHAQMLVE